MISNNEYQILNIEVSEKKDFRFRIFYFDIQDSLLIFVYKFLKLSRLYI